MKQLPYESLGLSLGLLERHGPKGARGTFAVSFWLATVDRVAVGVLRSKRAGGGGRRTTVASGVRAVVPRQAAHIALPGQRHPAELPQAKRQLLSALRQRRAPRGATPLQGGPRESAEVSGTVGGDMGGKEGSGPSGLEGNEGLLQERLQRAQKWSQPWRERGSFKETFQACRVLGEGG